MAEKKEEVFMIRRPMRLPATNVKAEISPEQGAALKPKGAAALDGASDCRRNLMK